MAVARGKRLLYAGPVNTSPSWAPQLLVTSLGCHECGGVGGVHFCYGRTATGCELTHADQLDALQDRPLAHPNWCPGMECAASAEGGAYACAAS